MAQSKIINVDRVIASGTAYHSSSPTRIWDYVKFADGRLEAWITMSDSTSSSRHEFSGYFPTEFSFVSTPTLVASGFIAANVNSGVKYTSVTTTVYDIYVAGDINGASYAYVFVKGKWK